MVDRLVGEQFLIEVEAIAAVSSILPVNAQSGI